MTRSSQPKKRKLWGYCWRQSVTHLFGLKKCTTTDFPLVTLTSAASCSALIYNTLLYFLCRCRFLILSHLFSFILLYMSLYTLCFLSYGSTVVHFTIIAYQTVEIMFCELKLTHSLHVVDNTTVTTIGACRMGLLCWCESTVLNGHLQTKDDVFFFFFPVLSVCCSCLFATRHQQQDYKRKVMYKLYSVGPDVECIHLLWNPSKWKRSLWAPLKPYTCSNSQMHTQLFPSQREMAKNRKRKPLRVSVSSV